MKKNLILIFISFFLIFIVLEISLRLLGFHEPIKVLCYDPIMTRVYCKNTEGYLVHDIVKSYIKVNSDGLLDKEYSKEKPKDTFRIAVLGDSFTAAEYTGHEKSFHGIWEEELPKRLNKPFEIINFAVDGTGTWRQLQMFNLKAKHYNPDLTVLVFYWGNDIYNNIEDKWNNGPNPLLNEYPENSFFSNVKVLRKNFNKWLWNHLSSYQFVKKRYSILEHKIRHILIPNIKNYFVKDAIALEVNEEDTFQADLSSTQHVHHFNSKGWKITRELIVKLNKDVLASGSEFLLIHFAAQNEFEKDYYFPVNQFNAFLNKNKIKYINIFNEFKKIGYKGLKDYFIPEDIHFNVAGHRKFADMTIELLVRNIKQDK